LPPFAQAKLLNPRQSPSRPPPEQASPSGQCWPQEIASSFLKPQPARADYLFGMTALVLGA